MIHSLAWFAWLVSVLAILSHTRNPFHLIIIFFILTIVANETASHSTDEGRTDTPVMPVWGLAGMMIVCAGLFNAATSHFGQTELVNIPGQIPLFSGAVTLEAIVFGATNGLVLSGILITFIIVNRALPVRALIRLIPQAFYPAALAISISLTFLPTLMRRMTEIRDAQAIRGLQVRGIRDWGPLFFPLLVDSLERAFLLAESMTARGFACDPPGRAADHFRVGLAAGLAALCAGWITSLAGAPGWVTGLLLAAASIWMVMMLWAMSRGAKRTAYHVEQWNCRAWFVVAGSLLALAGHYLPLPAIQTALAYTPYPLLSLPEFQPLVGICALGLLAPALLTQEMKE